VAAVRGAGHSVRLLAPAAPARALLGQGIGEVEEVLDWDGPETAALLAGERTVGRLASTLETADVVVAFTRSEPVVEALRSRAERVLAHGPSPPGGGPHASFWLASGLSPLFLFAGPELPPPLSFSEDEHRGAQALGGDHLPEGFLAIHPGSGSPAKNWPADRFAEAAHRLAGGRPWLLVLGPAEAQAADWPAAVVVAREWPVRLLGAALSRAGLFLGNDSGVAHLAAASGAPTLTLFGPTDPALWAPVGSAVATLRAPGGDLSALTVDAVVETASASWSLSDGVETGPESRRRSRPGDRLPAVTMAPVFLLAALTTYVPASDPHVAVMGRVERPEPGRIRFGYPGVTLRVRFEGSSLGMRANAETPNGSMDVFVDGSPAHVVHLRKGDSDVVLAEGLGPGAHSVDVVHRTETWMSVVNVRGFLLPPEGRLLDPAPWPRRRMLFVGDSVTCGERIDRQPGETEPFASSNGTLSYGMLLARALDAQCHLVCYGGRGLVRDWRGRTDVLTGPQLFDLAVADEVGGPAWDHSSYVPDVVFVSLGTNDFNLAIGRLPERDPWVSAYVAFVRAIRTRYPDAQILLTEGAIVSDADDPERPRKTVLREYLDETARRLGDPRVRVVPSQHYPGDPSNAHPTREQHAAMARDLEPVIREVTGWGAPTDAAVPVDEEPIHKVVLKNAYVTVLHVTVPPGQSTRLHTHSHDGVAVRLSEGTIRLDVPGEASREPQRTHVGDTTAQPYAQRPVTHRVINVGTAPFEVVDIEFLKRPDGPPSAPLAPPVAENPSARAYRFDLAPGASTPQHAHERPYLIIAATPMQLRMTSPDGASMEHPIEAGDFHWVDRKVTHALTNAGAKAGVIVEVELK
jgi:quercetin dioxygenase-like cupin family protein/lysophospholipase L1-like esterase